MRRRIARLALAFFMRARIWSSLKATSRQPTVILFDRLDIGVGGVLPSFDLADLEEGRDRFRQFGLIVLHRQDVVVIYVLMRSP